MSDDLTRLRELVYRAADDPTLWADIAKEWHGQRLDDTPVGQYLRAHVPLTAWEVEAVRRAVPEIIDGVLAPINKMLRERAPGMPRWERAERDGGRFTLTFSTPESTAEMSIGGPETATIHMGAPPENPLRRAAGFQLAEVERTPGRPVTADDARAAERIATESPPWSAVPTRNVAQGDGWSLSWQGTSDADLALHFAVHHQHGGTVTIELSGSPTPVRPGYEVWLRARAGDHWRVLDGSTPVAAGRFDAPFHVEMTP